MLSEEEKIHIHTASTTFYNLHRNSTKPPALLFNWSSSCHKTTRSTIQLELQLPRHTRWQQLALYTQALLSAAPHAIKTNTGKCTTFLLDP